VLKQQKYPGMAGTLAVVPRDMIKTGALVLANGKYWNTQIVSEDWILRTTSVKTNTHIPGEDYAYHWWNLSLESGDKRYKTIWANGFGNQFIYIFPEINVVISTTGLNYEGDSWALINGIKKYLHLLDNKLNKKQ
jgi:CubicO group peptidase (beta-lactamase class C family)